MGVSVFTVSSNAGLLNLNKMPDLIEGEFIGDIADGSFGQEKKLIKDERVKQFLYISEGYMTIFNTKQLFALNEEIKIVEKLGVINNGDLEVIKLAVGIALEKNLYLKFEYD